MNVSLDGAHKVAVKIAGLVEDKIKNIENVIGGSAGDKLKGDKLANVIEGGQGADKVWGGAGKDQFKFATAVDAADRIKDFSHADDTIVLDNAIFTAFAKTGPIKEKMFHANAAGHDAHTAKQKLIYDRHDGSLWYDADGNGAGAAIEVAVLTNTPHNVDVHDFLIV